MDGVLAKPLRLEQLGQIIDLWCDVPPLATVDADEPPGVEVDLQQAFTLTSSVDLECMFQALGASDWLQVARLAHRISGAAMMLGVTDVVAAAREVESLAAEAGGTQGIAAAIERLRETVDCLSCVESGGFAMAGKPVLSIGALCCPLVPVPGRSRPSIGGRGLEVDLH